MSDAREAALKVLQQWTVVAAPPQIPERHEAAAARKAPPAGQALPTIPGKPAGRPGGEWQHLAPRDRAFAFDLVTGVLRWRNLLDAVIASRLRQPLDSLDLGVRAILWLGAYQLLLQGGTSDYAAVDTAVTLARRQRSTEKAAGLVNAVLRGITRLKPTRATVNPELPPLARLSRRAFAMDFTTQIGFAENVFPDPAASLDAHLAAVRSHPALYVERLRRIYGDEPASELLLRNNLRPVVSLRSDAEVLDVPASAGLQAHADARRFVVAADGWNDIVERLVRTGILSPQDPTSAKPVARVADLVQSGELPAPQRILDLCAGLGTKTLQLARAFPGARVFATDVDSDKLRRLAERAKTVAQQNVEVLPVGELEAGRGGSFDLVLADVPCSNTGVMSRRVQSRWRWPSLDRSALQALQLRLLTQAAALAGGGEGDEGGAGGSGAVTVYATCSIDPAENGERVGEFLRGAGAGLRVIAEALTLPSLATAGGPLGMHDGGYFAILRRPGGRSARTKEKKG